MTDTTANAQPVEQSPGTPPAADTPAKVEIKDAAKLDEDELLSRVYREVHKDEVSGDATKNPEQKAAPEDKGKAEADKGTPERDASGKFVSKNPELKADPEKPADKKEPAKKEDTEKKTIVDKDEKSTIVDTTEPDEKPAPKKDTGHFRGWSKEHQEAFGKLPPEAQSLLLERQKVSDGAFQRATQELAEYRRNADPILAALESHADYFDELSATIKASPADIIKGLVTTEQTLRFGTHQEKMTALMAMARDYGVALQPVETDTLAEPTSANSEHYAAFHDLKAQNARLQAQLASVQRQSEQVAHSSFAQSVSEMRSAVGEDGGPKYPHFDTLRGVMADILQRGEAKTIQEAYAKAEEPIRNAIEQRTAALRKSEEDRAAAERAKRAGAVNVTSAAMPVERFETEEEALAHAYRSAMAT